ncbi:signal peptidase I [Microbacterium hydrothermale]|uniref:signal peptidase I n=1 Tax=Microbacterium hydrothermale TaxID=857427 RepID=UPI0010A90870|nr:signal peptidase I [Microbacterium hydrothermale]
MPVGVGLRRGRRPGTVAHPHRGWRRARSALATAVLVVVSTFAFLTVVVPLLLGAQTYTILTGSMRPGMPPGSLIAVKPVAFDEVRVGDVVTYQIRSGDPAVVTHRVVGTTSSTGGDRLLITRGDANDLDDPPVQREQLRGSVVLAIPYFGYPAALFGGQARGAVIASAGVLIVGYGGALLILDLARSSRSRRRRPTTFGLVVVLVVGIAASVGSPAPAEATTGAADARLLLSVDGKTFTPDGAVSLFRSDAPLVPGGSVASVLWIRNGSTDAARAGILIDAAPRGEAPTDRELAEDVRLVVDDAAVDPGGEWVSDPIAPGATLRVDVALRLDPRAPNASRRGEALVTPSVRLTQAVGEGEPGWDPDGVLPLTGAAAAPSTALLVAGLLTLGCGIGLLRRRPERR